MRIPDSCVAGEFVAPLLLPAKTLGSDEGWAFWGCSHIMLTSKSTKKTKSILNKCILNFIHESVMRHNKTTVCR